MKKSQLRNIIRESIKELMNEQGGNPNNLPWWDTYDSWAAMSPNANLSPAPTQVDPNTPAGPGVNGTYRTSAVCFDAGASVCQPDPSLSYNDNLNQYSACLDPFASPCALAMKVRDGIPGANSQWPEHFCITNVGGTNVTSGGYSAHEIVELNSPDCGNTTTSGCDPSAWSNHANWTATFTNTVTNANNSCNFLNNKIAQFTGMIPNVGPVWANQLQCKLDLCNQLHSQNNC